jgi:predicted transporter
MVVTLQQKKIVKNMVVGLQTQWMAMVIPLNQNFLNLQVRQIVLMGMSANWLVPAILIGVGVYMLTRKSE